MLIYIGRVERSEHRQARGQLEGVQDQRDDGPGGGFETIALREQVKELGGPFGKIRGREDEENARAVFDGALEFEEARDAEREGGFGLKFHARLCERVAEKALDPCAVGGGKRDEKFARGRISHGTAQ